MRTRAAAASIETQPARREGRARSARDAPHAWRTCAGAERKAAAPVADRKRGRALSGLAAAPRPLRRRKAPNALERGQAGLDVRGVGNNFRAAIAGALQPSQHVDQAAAPDDEDEAPESADSLHDDEIAVYEELRDEKNALARELDAAAYHVSQNRALMSMVRRLPTTPAELVECWGWGETKASRRGERLLAVLEPHVDALRAEVEPSRAAKERGEVIEVSDDDDDDDAEEEEPTALRRERAAAAAESRRVRRRRRVASRRRAKRPRRGERARGRRRAALRGAALRAMESRTTRAPRVPPPPSAPAPAFLPLPETAEK